MIESGVTKIKTTPRELAQTILESIAALLCKENIFDCTRSDPDRWFRFEDLICEILAQKEVKP